MKKILWLAIWWHQFQYWGLATRTSFSCYRAMCDHCPLDNQIKCEQESYKTNKMLYHDLKVRQLKTRI